MRLENGSSGGSVQQVTEKRTNPAFAGLLAEREGSPRRLSPEGEPSNNRPLRGLVCSFRPLVRASSPRDRIEQTPLSRGCMRRGRDSNPRYPCEYFCFRDRPIRPLWHLSLLGGVPRKRTAKIDRAEHARNGEKPPTGPSSRTSPRLQRVT